MNGAAVVPIPLNLKAAPEERSEIIHGKAWLLDEVAWVWEQLLGRSAVP